MAGRSKRVTAEDRVAVDAGKVSARYQRWLARQPLAERTRDAYWPRLRVSWPGWPAPSTEAPHWPKGKCGTGPCGTTSVS